MASEPFIRTEFQLTAKFKHRKGGETEFKDIVAMSATFALNAIPTCTLDVATGIEVRTEEKATIHTVVDKLQPRDRCTVFLTIKSTEGRREAPIINGMKDGTYIVFDGYYAGIGYQRAHNNCSYTIHLVHWLDDLNCSSMLNGDWSQNVPHDLAQVASSIVVADLTGGGGSGAGARAVPMIDYKRPEPGSTGVIVTQANMEKDLWEEVIKKIFKGITEMKHPRLQCKPPKDEGKEPGPEKDGVQGDELGKPGDNNKAAAAALDLISGPKVPSKYKAKLPLNLKGFEGGDPFVYLSLSAHEGLCRMILDGMGYNTIWSKLIGDLAPSFLFAISPSVEFAQAIPFFPGLHKHYVTITGEEYNYANFNANFSNMISSIVIYWAPQGDASGAHQGGKRTPKHGYCFPAGKYPPDEADYRDHWGNILVRDPPAWLANPVYTMGYTRDNHVNTKGRSSLVPQEGNEKNPEAKEIHNEVEDTYLKKSKDTIDEKQLNVYDRFACHWYKSAILGQRYGELSGKLRFDIAPGSIVKIEPPVSEVGQSNRPMFGAVVQVSFAINAEQHTAGTSFALSHVRTEKENDINDPVSKKHYVGTRAPIYKDEPPGSPWPGGPLVVGQEPENPGAADAPAGADAPEFLAPGTFMV